VDSVEVFEGSLEGGAVFGGGHVEVLAEPSGGVLNKELGVFEALGVVGEAEVDELCVVLNFFEGSTGVVDFTIAELTGGQLGHGVDELRIEEALFARGGLLGMKLQLAQSLWIGKTFVDAGGTSGDTEGKEEGKSEDGGA